jgi:crotonobetainyl-CoA:carnitine CoA-transferase CaiB-like acyl-CoA transferase
VVGLVHFAAVIEDLASGVPPEVGPGPLAGLRVVELSTVVMGPLACRMLGDLGADVIKVEAPEGDLIRHLTPGRSAGMSGFWLNLNRNKRSVSLDLKRPEDNAAFRSLVASADVFVTNLRERALTALAVDADTLRAAHPELVYCWATGFDATGPYAGRAAYDDVIQAASGLAALFEAQRGEPAFVPSAIADKIVALHIVYAVTAALLRRERLGGGDSITIPMAEVLAAFNLVEHIGGHAFEPTIGSFGYARTMSPQRRPRRSKDGWVCILPYSDQNWLDFFAMAGLPHLADDPRFATLSDRVDHVDELYELLGDIVATRTTEEWLQLCHDASIPAAPVVDLADVADDPQLGSSGLLRLAEHPSEGPYRVIADPVSFDRGSGGVRRHAPRLGEHTDEVLSELTHRD